MEIDDKSYEKSQQHIISFSLKLEYLKKKNSVIAKPVKLIKYIKKAGIYYLHATDR